MTDAAEVILEAEIESYYSSLVSNESGFSDNNLQLVGYSERFFRIYYL